MSGDTTVIDVKYFNQLKDSHAFLNALYAAGVDNWDGYDNAVEILEENK